MAKNKTKRYQGRALTKERISGMVQRAPLRFNRKNPSGQIRAKGTIKRGTGFEDEG